MGWRLTSGGVQVIPHNLGAWIVANGEASTWALEGLHDSGKWEITAYNTDLYPHTVYVTFLLSLIRPRPGLSGIFGYPLITPVPDLSQAGPPVPGRP